MIMVGNTSLLHILMIFKYNMYTLEELLPDQQEKHIKHIGYFIDGIDGLCRYVEEAESREEAVNRLIDSLDCACLYLLHSPDLYWHLFFSNVKYFQQ